MKTTILILFLAFTVNSVISQISKEQSGNFILKGKHNIGISVGLNNKTSVLVSGANVETKLGFSGGVFYNYGVSNEIAMEFYAGYLHGETNSYPRNVIIIGNYINQKTAFVAPVFVGAKYYPKALSIDNNARPYVSAHAGVLMGFTTTETINSYYLSTTEVKSQSVFAGKMGAGIELATTRLFHLGFFTGYLYASDFKDAVGTLRNYSGVEFNITAGFAL